MKALLWSTGIFILLVLGALFFTGKKGYELVVSPSQINEHLERAFPLTETYFEFVQVTYSDPKMVTLVGENRLQIGLDVTASIQLGPLKKGYLGQAVVKTGVRYESDSQQFFLVDAELTHLAMDGLPPQYLKELTTRLAGHLEPFSKEMAVYKLKDQSAALRAAGLLIREVDIVDRGIQITLGF